jgi:hypothetical protein
MAFYPTLNAPRLVLQSLVNHCPMILLVSQEFTVPSAPGINVVGNLTANTDAVIGPPRENYLNPAWAA